MAQPDGETTMMKKIRNYKTFILVIFSIYLAMVVVFHRELQGTPIYSRLLQFDRNHASPGGHLKNSVVIQTRLLTENLRKNLTGDFRLFFGESGDKYDPYGFKKPFHKSCLRENKGFTVPNIHKLGNTYFYSASYDDRRVPHQIRIMSLVQKQNQPKLTCVFPGGATTRVVYYQMCENHNRPYGGWFASCPVPKNLTSFPCQIRITTMTFVEEKPVEIKVTIPVQASNGLSRTPKKEFGLCVPPLYGHIDPKLLVRFIEINQLLGANHINFYTLPQINRDVLVILQHYEEKGVVSWFKWKLPVVPSTVWYHGQLITINDCLYRNMYNFKYLAFHDIDELLVPHKYATWSEMVKGLPSEHNNTPVAGYMFNSAFFKIDKRKTALNANFQHFVSETERARIISRVRTKPFVEPRKIFELGIHHISRPMEDFLHPHRVDERSVLLHHYRKCTTEFDPRMKCKAMVNDTILERFGNKLSTRFNKNWNEIFKSSGDKKV